MVMFHSQGASRQSCSLLAVLCGRTADYDQKKDVPDGVSRYCFPRLYHQAFGGLFGALNGETLAEALHAKGIPYVMYWKSVFSCYAASHFRHAFLCVAQSSTCHVWDAFQLAHASFRLYCVQNNLVLPEMSQKAGGDLGPHLLGDPPKPMSLHLEAGLKMMKKAILMLFLP
ncbi:hypothetical protein HAX54_034280 [Datura stramonium]|uniref:Uncharacterized protein n=1 Tax=Datura stramonium TaxID=4076 RepID=A0ABS8VG03_DATST|nr:hypothetical protein [Datura stramonium]